MVVIGPTKTTMAASRSREKVQHPLLLEFIAEEREVTSIAHV